MTPTIEQSVILSASSGEANLIIRALAGTGKTSTLELIEHAVKTRPILYLAFNKKVAEEAEKRMASTTTVRTFNGLGHRIWAKAVGKNLTLQPKKTQEHLRALIDQVPKRDQGPIWDSFWEVFHGVSLAKALGYVPDGKFPTAKRLISQSDFHKRLDEKPDDLVSDLIDAVLLSSIKAAYEGAIDFNDQVYMPALFGGTYPRFPLAMIDEAQDMSPVNHAMVDKLAQGRKTIAVGDPYQSIYGFRGAKQGGMSDLATRFSMTPLDLSVSFRCPQAIVENARWRVPNFKWIKEGGHVEQLKGLHPSAIPDGASILCRNNAPLFRTALHLLGHKRGVSVAGSDIGPKIIAIMKKLGDESLSRQGLLGAIEDWRAERIAKDSTTANDMAECMKVFASFGDTLGQAMSYAEHLFQQRGSIRLMTGHKAKGLEFDTVYHLDPGLCRDDEQDLNLRYVIQTRSRNAYYEIDSHNINW